MSAQTLNPKPVKALGAPRLIATQSNPLAVDTFNPNWVEGRELYQPSGVAIDNSAATPALYVSDTRNNRILGWRSTQFAGGTPADIILGQPNGYRTLAGGPGTNTSQGLNSPTGIAVDTAGNVYVADSGNNRVVRFPAPLATPLPQGGQVLPDLVIGQASFAVNGANQGGISASSLSLASGAGAFPLFAGLAFDGAGNLYVSDVNNNRVLSYPAAALKGQGNGPAANLVIGQFSYAIADTKATGLSPGAFNKPNGLAIDYKGRLYVGDSLGRVLVFLPPFAIGSNAARLVGIQTVFSGQPPPPPVSNTTVGYPQGLTMVGNRLVVVDAADHRALVFDPYEAWPDPAVTISPVAYEILGQSGYADNLPNRGQFVATASSLNVPLGVAATAAELFVVDSQNNRLSVFPIQNGLPAGTATRVVGQLFTSLNAPNLIEGREFSLVSGGFTGAVAVDRSASPPHLYVSDPGNNRILCFNDARRVNPGDVADLVIGQPSVLQSVLNYASGGGGDPAKPNASGLNNPTALAIDSSGNLWVADSGNSRVLRFPPPFGPPASGLPAANLVIGQAGFTSQITDPTAATVLAPTGLAFTSDGSLLVSDTGHNRVLFFPQPLSSGMSAAKVIGQTDFSSGSANGNPPDPARFNAPEGIAVDSQNRIYVCDIGGGRIAVFGSPAFLQPTHAPPVFSLTQGLHQPIGVAVGPATAQNPGEVWVADAGANALIHFPAFAQLSQNSSPDGSVPANTPFAVAYDSFGNLIAADGANRVLFYVPLISVTDAANYLTRAVAPGSVISIFPSPSSNVLGAATASFNSVPNPFPLPTFLGDTQVLINLQPAQLFYVSPSQINLPLSFNLPASGAVDIRVVSKSTGQIYGDTDLTLTPVSPGLFTLNSAGSGQLAALNEDNSVNGPGNPLTRGHVIQMFGTGQGQVSNAPADGMPASGLSSTVAVPQIQIGSISVDPGAILYSGLAPGLIGVWQIDVAVPTTVTAGNSVLVTVSLNSVPANDPSNPFVLRTTIALQ